MSEIHNSQWRLVTLAIAPGAEEDASVMLFELGSAGIVTLEETLEHVKLGAYFDHEVNDLRRTIEAGLARAGLGGELRGLSVETVVNQDWMQKWKDGFTPIEVGNRLIVSPSWSLPGKSEGKIVIQIDPGMAFGTGTHETTRLCLEAIDRYWSGGSLLDVGTGTGILAIAAALLAPGSRVVAIDVDPQAVEIARENIAINGLSGAVELFEAQPGRLTGKAFDVVAANLTAEVIVDLMSDLASCVAPEGTMILSGILGDLSQDVERALTASGFSVTERRDDGEWCSLIARRSSQYRGSS